MGEIMPPSGRDRDILGRGLAIQGVGWTSLAEARQTGISGAWATASAAGSQNDERRNLSVPALARVAQCTPRDHVRCCTTREDPELPR